MSCTVSPLSVNNSHFAACWFCVTTSTGVLYSLSNVRQYLKICSLLVLCHYVHWCLVKSVNCLSISHIVQSVGSVSQRPQVICTAYPLSVTASQGVVCWFCVTTSTDVLYSMSIVCQYLTLCSLLVLGPYVNWCLVQYVKCLPIPHIVKSVGSVSLRPLVSCTVCQLSYSTPHCAVCCLYVTTSTGVLYSMSIVCQYRTMCSLLILCQYVHWCLVQSVNSLSIPHIVQSVVSMSLGPLVSCTVRPLSVITAQCAVC